MKVMSTQLTILEEVAEATGISPVINLMTFFIITDIYK